MLICSRALTAALGERCEGQFVQCLLEDRLLLPWYVQGLLQSFRDESISRRQVGAAFAWHACLRALYPVRRAACVQQCLEQHS